MSNHQSQQQIDTLFYSLLRNCYIRGCIGNIVCKDTFIQLNNVQELLDHQYLSMFSVHNKLNNNINISLNISNRDQFNQYIGCKYKDIINCIRFIVQQQQEDYQLDLNIPEGVHIVSYYVNRNTSISGDTLPQSLTELKVYTDEGGNFINTRLDDVLCNLPSSLRRLSLPGNYIVSKQIVLPSTLEYFEYTAHIKCLKMIQVPLNKTFTSCQVIPESLDDVMWIHSQPWISQLVIRESVLQDNVITRGIIPSHIKDLRIFMDDTDIVFEEDSLPQGLTTLFCISMPTTTLPQQLTILSIDQLDDQLQKDILPPTLTTLIISDYNCYKPLLPGVLPKGLQKLSLKWYNDVIDDEVLPSSLMYLSLPDFCFRIKPYSLPSSLTYLDLQRYSFYFDSQYLNRLSTLKVDHLHPCIASAINGTNNITISCTKFDPDINLQQITIQHLKLYLNSPDRLSLKPQYIPNGIKSLSLSGFNIESSGLIPNSCLSLKTDIKDININLIPSKTKHIYIN